MCHCHCWTACSESFIFRRPNSPLQSFASRKTTEKSISQYSPNVVMSFTFPLVPSSLSFAFPEDASLPFAPLPKTPSNLHSLTPLFVSTVPSSLCSFFSVSFFFFLPSSFLHSHHYLPPPLLFLFDGAVTQWRRGNIASITTQPVPDSVNSVQQLQPPVSGGQCPPLSKQGKKALLKLSRFCTSFLHFRQSSDCQAACISGQSRSNER